MKLFGVEFAPISIPMERRLQTLGALWLSFLFFGCGACGISLIAYLIFFSNYSILGYTYLLFLVLDQKALLRDDMRSSWCRNWRVWGWARDYFPIRLFKMADLNPSKSFICAYHPHGVMPSGVIISLLTNALKVDDLFPGLRITVCTLGIMHWLPVYRDMICMLGGRDVNRSTIRSIVSKKGNAAVIIVGGAAEALEGQPGEYVLVLKNRKGFVREAIISGSYLVPIFGFGENAALSIKHTEPGTVTRWFQEMMKKVTGFTLPLVRGRGVFQYSFGLLPHRRPITVVVGRPIEVVQNSDPSREEVDALHAKYMDELQKMFDQNSSKYEENATLSLL